MSRRTLSVAFVLNSTLVLAVVFAGIAGAQVQSPPACAQQVSRFTFGGPRDFSGFAADDGYAVTIDSLGVSTWSLVDPLNPEHVASWFDPGVVGWSYSEVALDETGYAYVAVEHGEETSIEVFDVRELTDPRPVFRIDAEFQDFSVTGSSLVLISTELTIYDISNAESPLLVCDACLELGAGYQQENGAARGQYVYVTDLDQLEVIDISEPASPVRLATVQLPFMVAPETDVLCSDQLVAVNSAGLLGVIGVADPAEPIVYPGSTGLDMPPRGGEFHGSSLFLSGYGIEIVDLSVPSAPVVVGTVDPCPWTTGISVVNDLVYGVCLYGMVVLDANAMGDPIGTSAEPANVYDVAAYESLAAVALGDRGLAFVDIAASPDPEVLAEIDLSSRVTGVAVGPGTAIAMSFDQLQVVDLQDPTDPQLVAPLTTQMERATGIAIAEQLLVVAQQEPDVGGGIEVFTFTDAQDLQSTDWVPFDADEWRLRMHDNLAFVFGTSHLHIVDVSNPADAALLSSTEVIQDPQTSDRIIDVIVVDDLALARIVQWPFLYTIDVSNPEAPSVTGASWDWPHFFSAASMGTTIVLVGTTSPFVTDLSDSALPVHRAFEPVRKPTEVAVTDGHFLLAAGPLFEIVSFVCAPPEADFGWYQSGLHAWFEALVDYSPMREPGFNAEIDWTVDGVWVGSGLDFRHTFTYSGSYEVALEVNNEWGFSSITKTLNISAAALVFADGFESGGTAAWSAAVP